MSDETKCPECGAPAKFVAALHADRSPGYIYTPAPSRDGGAPWIVAPEEALSGQWEVRKPDGFLLAACGTGDFGKGNAESIVAAIRSPASTAPATGAGSEGWHWRQDVLVSQILAEIHGDDDVIAELLDYVTDPQHKTPDLFVRMGFVQPPFPSVRAATPGGGAK